ncbi:DUF4105 domain-containing protein [uncultured Nitrospira sp.]|uniref:Lnb N-terminal periplasmic domain-containing protein n=1 Tax=uncultured Nitrospira sp. TaxID=157176 RepID=UPI00314020D1
MGVWGTFALYFDGPEHDMLRTLLASCFGVATLAALAGYCTRRGRWIATGSYLSLFFVLFVWWSMIEPSNDRVWQPEVAVLPYAIFDENLITVHNIRNFDYRTETDFTTAYYDRTYDLSKLDSADIVAAYWMGPMIAHIFLTFGFGDDHLAISIEARKEATEGYSSIRGFFKQYELIYIVADERDLIRVRTNYRKDPPEDVYLYRLAGSPENAKRVFLEYMNTINELRERPKFYNTLTANCTNVIWMHARLNPGHVPFSWKILLSGFTPAYLHEQRKLDTNISFEELQRRSHVNERAWQADQSADFSGRIRARPLPL